MRFYADLHIHSKFSRATARNCDLEHLAYWARKKGLAIIATGDFTHPGWMAELREGLIEAGPGVFRLRPELQKRVDERLPPACRGEVRFVLSVEISTIYKKGDRTRKVHHVVYAPDLASAERFTARLARVGNLASDGRPILGLDSRDLLEITLESGEGNYLVPAHIWTPWFSALGSKSGFDAIDECYADLSSHIFAVETGLSSDPEMNWRVASLDRFRLVSNSDAHSPPMLGREACIFDTDPDYFAVRRALETGEGYAGTVEFYPEEGKYHLDGHRKCGVRLTPEQTRELGGRCPECGGPITVGVMSRVEDLAEPGFRPPPRTAGEVRSLVPLPEILSEIEGVGPKSKRVSEGYERLVSRLGPELAILSDLSLDEFKKAGSSLLTEAIGRLREGRVIRQAGYDGEYGVIRLFERDELGRRQKGGLLFDEPSASDEPPSPVDEPFKRLRVETVGTPESEGAAGDSRERRQPLPGNRQPATNDPILSGLDPEQRAAAETVTGPLLIVAGPGSGKTRTLTRRMAHLARDHGVDPKNCLAVTFTRRAAGEMRERLQTLLPETGAAFPVFTFHSLGLEILREHGSRLGLDPGFRVASERERIEVLVSAVGVDEHRARPLLDRISRAKRGDEPGEGETEEARFAYEIGVRERNLLDFDDLIGMAVRLLDEHDGLRVLYRERYRYVSIDEYQDIDSRQYRLVRMLCPPGANLCVIGDPDQAIYAFRGSDPRFFGRFRRDYPNAARFTLKRNYRSGGNIVRASAQVMEGHRDADRALRALLESPERIAIHEAASEKAEAEFVVAAIERLLGGHSFFSVDSGRSDGSAGSELSFSDFAVLYRTEAQAAAPCEALSRSGIPFQVRSHRRLCEQPGVMEIVKCFELDEGGGLVHERLERAARAAVAESGIETDEANAARDLLAPLARERGDDAGRFLSELMLGADVDTWDPRADRVSLLTLHAAKGLEFPVVFILGCERGLLPLSFGDSGPDDIEEERRLFYVGMTRARERLLLCRAKKRRVWGKVRPREASPFLLDIREELVERQKARSRRGRKKEKDRQLDLF
jgi:DNA helicase-2/ATP-dependent DNA helicase PcrA